jgi:hypothetical protein
VFLRQVWPGADPSKTTTPTVRAADIGCLLGVMAKVMVSMPDDLLSEVDAEADRLGTARSAVLRQFADSALRGRRTNRAAAMRVLVSRPRGDRFASP